MGFEVKPASSGSDDDDVCLDWVARRWLARLKAVAVKKEKRCEESSRKEEMRRRDPRPGGLSGGGPDIGWNLA